MEQSASTILMVRPANFGFNVETAASNAFQKMDDNLSPEQVRSKALLEFDSFVQKLRSVGVQVLVYEEKFHPKRTDAIFPNNWISFHQDARVVLYPMESVARRLERTNDVLDLVETVFEIDEVIDLSPHEKEHRYLEGTGSIIFDYQNRIAYACRSTRTEEDLFKETCAQLGFDPVIFAAEDQSGKPIYHTNVMMAIGTGYAVICLQSIADDKERAIVQKRLESTNHDIVDISFDQLKAFAGNMLEVRNNENKRYLVMSESACRSLNDDQMGMIKMHATPLPVNISTIETIGGGSARCMMAAVHLPLQE